jgi:hypothetical protein
MSWKIWYGSGRRKFISEQPQYRIPVVSIVYSQVLADCLGAQVIQAAYDNPIFSVPDPRILEVLKA